MNKYLKEFLHRGLMFGGFGPMVVGIIFVILSHSIDGFSITAEQILLAIISTYLLAFVQAGASVFNRIEEWSLPKSLLCHFASIYLTYIAVYLINSWIPFIPAIIAIFTLIFVVTYIVIWLCVYFTVRAVSKKLNTKI